MILEGFKFVAATFIGWTLATMVKKNEQLLEFDRSFNMICVNQPKFECVKQILPSGKIIVVVLERGQKPKHDHLHHSRDGGNLRGGGK